MKVVFIEEEKYQEIKNKLGKEEDYFSEKEFEKFTPFLPPQYLITKNNLKELFKKNQ